MTSKNIKEPNYRPSASARKTPCGVSVFENGLNDTKCHSTFAPFVCTGMAFPPHIIYPIRSVFVPNSLCKDVDKNYNRHVAIENKRS